jgi:hypothetical protein
MEFHDLLRIIESGPDVYDTLGGGSSSFLLYGVEGEKGMMLSSDGKSWTSPGAEDSLMTFPSEKEAWDHILAGYEDVRDWAERGRERPRFLGRFTRERGRLRRIKILDRYEINPRF